MEQEPEVSVSLLVRDDIHLRRNGVSDAPNELGKRIGEAVGNAVSEYDAGRAMLVFAMAIVEAAERWPDMVRGDAEARLHRAAERMLEEV